MKKSIIILLITLLALFSFVGCDSTKYERAQDLYAQGMYEEALAIFTELGDYEDSQSMVNDCVYNAAKIQYENGDYENALTRFVQLGDYKDSAEWTVTCKCNIATMLYEKQDYQGVLEVLSDVSGNPTANELLHNAEIEIMLIEYADVIGLLCEEQWYFNGGSNELLNEITFTQREAKIHQIYVDGRSDCNAGTYTCEYTVDEKTITVERDDDFALKIPYIMQVDGIVLGQGEIFSSEQVEEGITGCWVYNSSVSGYTFRSKEYFEFSSGFLTKVSTSTIYGVNNGTTTHSGKYSVDFSIGGFDADIEVHSPELRFNIIDGEVVLLRYGNVCSRVNSLPGT